MLEAAVVENSVVVVKFSDDLLRMLAWLDCLVIVGSGCMSSRETPSCLLLCLCLFIGH